MPNSARPLHLKQNHAMNKKHSITTALLMVLLMSACSKKEEASAQTDGAEKTSESADFIDPAAAAANELMGENAHQANTVSSASRFDPNKPFDTYPEIKGGQQLMFQYVAASGLPPDFSKLAEVFSQEYRRSNDSFRRNDLMQALKPQMEQLVAAAKAEPYGWLVVNSPELGAYDFERKGFPIGSLQNHGVLHFNDEAYTYGITWSNAEQMAFAPVENETTAREIEANRSSYNKSPYVKVFFFSEGADLNGEDVKGRITQVQIVDRSGRILVSYGPDGSPHNSNVN